MILSTVQLPLLRKLTISNGPNSDKASRIFYLSFDHWRERTDGEREMICRVTSIQGFWNRTSVPWIEVSLRRGSIMYFLWTASMSLNSPLQTLRSRLTFLSMWLFYIFISSTDKPFITFLRVNFFVNNNEEIEIHVDMILFTLYLRQVEVISVHQRYPHWVSSVVQV